MLLFSSADFFKINFFSKNSFNNSISMPNGLDPDQGLHSDGPGLGPNCLQRLSADDKSRSSLATKQLKAEENGYLFSGSWEHC